MCSGDMAGAAIIAALTEAVRKPFDPRHRRFLSRENLLTEMALSPALQIRDTNDPLCPARGQSAQRHSCLATGIGHPCHAVTNLTGRSQRSRASLSPHRAGAVIADPEFVQFHPTAIMAGRDPARSPPSRARRRSHPGQRRRRR